ncbi:MAG TPA: TIGR02444 family protein [Stellaceae bacterium]|nr:TIGR02444 family protein [Stellaceae bacterium]
MSEASAAPPPRASSRGDPDEAFWRFSLDFYRLPGVEGALIALQDQAGHDVNLILYALWLGWSGRGRLDERELAAAAAAAGPIRERITAPLRELRRRLRSDPDPAVQSLREHLKALELEAERIAQSRLAAQAGPPAARSAQSRRAAARANLARALGQQAGSAEAAILAQALDRLPE